MSKYVNQEAVCNFIAEFVNHPYSTQEECERVDAMISGINHMESIEVEEEEFCPVKSVEKILNWCEENLNEDELYKTLQQIYSIVTDMLFEGEEGEDGDSED